MNTYLNTYPGWVSISAFASLVCISICIARFPVGLEICAITAGIKNYKSVIKKKKRKHDKITLLAKTKVNTIEVLIPRALIDLYISHGEFVSVNNMSIIMMITWKKQ